MIKAHEGLPVYEFEPPDSVRFYEIDKSSGRLGGSFREAFLTNTAPPTSGGIQFTRTSNEQLMEQELLGIVPSAEPEAMSTTDHRHRHATRRRDTAAAAASHRRGAGHRTAACGRTGEAGLYSPWSAGISAGSSVVPRNAATNPRAYFAQSALNADLIGVLSSLY
jgi:hypothetical protein